MKRKKKKKKSKIAVKNPTNCAKIVLGSKQRHTEPIIGTLKQLEFEKN